MLGFHGFHCGTKKRFAEEYRNVLKDLEIRKNGDWVYEDSEAEIADVLSDVPEDVRRRLICVMKEHQYVVDAVDGLETKDFQNLLVR